MEKQSKLEYKCEALEDPYKTRKCSFTREVCEMSDKRFCPLYKEYIFGRPKHLNTQIYNNDNKNDK